MLHCDDHGALYQVNPDGSFTETLWVMFPAYGSYTLARRAGKWTVMNQGEPVVVMDCRASAYNFLRHAP